MTYDEVIFDPDVYGTYARRSATADYLELLVLAGHGPIRRAHLEDFISQNGWEGLLSTRFDSPGVGMRKLTAGAASRSVFDVLAERSEVLGERYPFDATLDYVGAANRSSTSTYIALLALTTCHAYRIPTDFDMTIEFEYLVEAALAGRIGLATAFRRHGGAGDGFAGAVTRAAKATGLTAVLDQPDLVVSTRAVDEGLDVLGHINLGDRRPGLWTFVGQATVANSNEWQRKAEEARPAKWRKLLGDAFEPRGFLAVPHHIDEDHWRDLIDSKRTLLDRLRIASAVRDESEQVVRLCGVASKLRVEGIFPN